MANATTKAARELGDLAPIRAALERIRAWETEDRARRPENDPTVHALAEVGSWLETALETAVAGADVLSVAEAAALEGVTPWALYKRRRRGKLENAEKRGGRIRISSRAA